MKKYANVDSDGTGVIENPYTRVKCPIEQDEILNEDYHEFANTHPPLKVYTKNNELVTNCRAEVEGPIHQGKLLEEQEWGIITKDEYDGFEFGPFITVRQIYVAEEAEKDLEDIEYQKWIDAGAPFDQNIPISQPVKEVKSARDIAKEILYFPVTNDQGEASIQKGTALIEAYAQFTNSNMVEGNRKESARRKAYQIFLRVWGKGTTGKDFDNEEWHELNKLLCEAMDASPFKNNSPKSETFK